MPAMTPSWVLYTSRKKPVCPKWMETDPGGSARRPLVASIWARAASMSTWGLGFMPPTMPAPPTAMLAFSWATRTVGLMEW